jgi:uncharacterized sulfatase
MRAAIAAVTDKPALVINTHHHPDHFLGNQAFAGVPIGALAETRQAIAAEGDAFAENLFRMSGDWMKGTELQQPTRTLAPARWRLPAAACAWWPSTGTPAPTWCRTRRAGCDRRRPGLPSRAHHAPRQRSRHWLAALDRLEALTREPGFKVLLPGHGQPAAAAPIRQTRAWLVWLAEAMRQAARDGLDMNEVLARPLPPEFASLPLAASEYRRSVGHLFPAAEQDVLEGRAQ